VRDFVNADDWEATRAVVEAQQARLYVPEVETLFEQNIAHARATGDERAVRLLELHLALLRKCIASGIEAAFANLHPPDEETLPFDPDLISRSIAALLGSPQDKMAHMQYLATAATEVTDDGMKALFATIQLALFSDTLAQLGRDLKGVYRQAWETIAASVEAGGVDPRLFEALVQKTLAVLGPAASQQSAWRTTLADWRNQATAQGDRNLSALLDAVIGLLDANGNPAGLGTSLQGVYARTWLSIVERLPG